MEAIVCQFPANFDSYSTHFDNNEFETNISQDHMAYRFITSVRGTLISMIYAKTIDLSITALDESAAVTLMASDTGMYSSSLYD
jgi:hypothetical protein